MNALKLQVLNFHSTVKNTDAHHSQKVVGSVGVVVDTTKEGSGGISADRLLDEVSASWVVVDEAGAVVDETVDGNEGSLLGFGLEVLPRDDGKVVARLGPLDRTGLFLEHLELHGVLSLLDLVVGELLEVRSEAELRHGPDEPLGGVVLVPLDGVAEVHGELVVEVVVTFADGDKGSDEVVLGGVLVVEGRLTEPVGKRVDTESRVVDKDETSGSCKEETALPVSPSETSDNSGENETHEDHEHNVVVVLPLDDGIAAQVRDVCDTNLSTGLDKHPSDVSPPETLVGRVGVKLGVGIAVVSAVAARPPLDGALNGARTAESEEVLEGLGGVVRAVSPQTVVTSGDAETSHKVVDDGPDKSLPLELHGAETVNSHGWGNSQSGEGDPLNVLKKVPPCDRRQHLHVLDGASDIVLRNNKVLRLGVDGLWLNSRRWRNSWDGSRHGGQSFQSCLEGCRKSRRQKSSRYLIGGGYFE